MPVLALVVSYRRATIDLLERLSFPESDEPKAYHHLRGLDGVSEAVILSTCNRVEVYTAVDTFHEGFQGLKLFLSESREVPVEEFAHLLHPYDEDEAAGHLFTVAAGLDSMVLGEPQILQQVRGAFRRAETEGAAGPLLSGMFREAVRVGRRVRRETAVGTSPTVFAEAGVSMAAEHLGGLEGRSALVIGAGKMAALAIRPLRDRGVARIRVLNHTVERAARLAQRAGVEHGPLDELVPALDQADVVVCSTGATGVIVEAAAVRVARRGRSDPLFLVDLAVPRDVDPAAKDLPGVRVVDIDDLREAVWVRRDGSAAEVERARVLVHDEVRGYAARRQEAHLAPLIRGLHARGEDVRAGELRRFASRLAGLSERERGAVEALAGGIVAKLLHEPVVRLKRLAASGSADQHARALADLFGIEDQLEE